MWELCWIFNFYNSVKVTVGIHEKNVHEPISQVS